MRTIVFTREDGSQALVTLYDAGNATLAEREQPSHVWGPPIEPDEAAAVVAGFGAPLRDIIDAARRQHLGDLDE